MELQTIRQRILATPLVSKLPEAMRQRFVQMLLWLADTREVSREEHLFKLGDKHNDEGVLILEGMVRIITESSERKTIEAPDILGEVQLFTPEGARTATVEVVVGGQILTFQWKTLAAEAKRVYSEDEWQTLRKTITESAWRREAGLFDAVKGESPT